MPTISQGRVTAGTGNVVFVPAVPNSGTGTSTVAASLAATSGSATISPQAASLVAPSFSITGTWEPEQQIVVVAQFNMVFNGVQIVGGGGNYLEVFHYTEGISD